MTIASAIRNTSNNKLIPFPTRRNRDIAESAERLPAQPHPLVSLSEPARFLGEIGSLMLSSPLLRFAPKGQGQPVMTLPGLLGADGSTAVIRRWLNRWGYQAHPWELGRNFPLRPEMFRDPDATQQFHDKMVERALDRIKTIHDQSGQKVSLVGWSLGGVYANKLAQDHADLLERVVTLGSPLGDPRGTIVYPLIRRYNGGEDRATAEHYQEWIDSCRGESPRPVPVTVIYSHVDGFVHVDQAKLDGIDNIEHVHVPSSHVGMGFHPWVMWAIAKALSQSTQ